MQQFAEEFSIFKLKHLDLSHSNLSSDAPHLFCQTFLHLESLILRSCDLSSENVSCLAQANTWGKFPRLKHLDVTRNSCKINDLFETKSHWNELQIVRICEDFRHWQDSVRNIVQLLQSGFLNRLQELHVETWDDHLDYTRCRLCGSLSEDAIADKIRRESEARMGENRFSHKDVLAPLVNHLDILGSSSLGAIYICSPPYFFNPKNVQVEKQRIRSRNIMLHFVEKSERKMLEVLEDCLSIVQV